jgi:crossover junction endodeoxyribonuclease RuvC
MTRALIHPPSATPRASGALAAGLDRMILGVDPGSRVAGYAFIRARTARPLTPRDFEIVDCGVLRAQATLGYAERIALLHEALHGLISLHSPDVLVLEKAFVDKNVSSALRLGEVRGAFIAAAGRCGVRSEEITPAEVKKTITGNGRADKDQVSATLKTLAGFDRGALPHDVTDALAISYCFGLKLTTKWALQSLGAAEAKR